MRKHTLHTFGPTFAMMTVEFIKSGQDKVEIPCETKGLATNLRMRFHQFWKIAAATMPSELPPDLAAVQAQLNDLTMLNDPKKPTSSFIARKSERKMDAAILKAMGKMQQPQPQTASVAPGAPANREADSKDPMTKALSDMGLLEKPEK